MNAHDVPTTPHAERFALHLATVLAAYHTGTLSVTELAMSIIEYLAQDSGAAVKHLDAEHATMHASRQHPLSTLTEADYERLKAELNRIAAIDRLIRHPRGLLGDRP